ncbi:MAG: discoidin domain-containing protein [Cyanobacteria bacterium REEB67]|nr:discoidin domain-containing protein [Cyanobacteria bacterium REEB67]
MSEQNMPENDWIKFDLHADDVSLVSSDGVTARLSRSRLKGKGALRLDYEFKGAGHALIRVPVALRLPANYVFRFSVKGLSPANTLEFKCVDPSGENVWWVNRPSFSFTPRWQTLANKKRHFTYAWGPVNKPLVDVGFVELTVSATAGGRGTLYFADLTFAELAADAASGRHGVSVRTSSAKAAAASISTAESGVDADAACSGWHSSASDRQYVQLDFGAIREFDGLRVDFGDDYAASYDVQLPHGKNGWRTADTVDGGSLRRQYHALPESEAGSLRLVLKKPARAGRGYHLKAVILKPIGFAATTSQFFANIGQESGNPAGYLPRYFGGEQSFWTVVGVSGGREKAIINEEGMIEPSLQAPSLEPFIYSDGRLLTWADGTHHQCLVEESLPMPIVRRIHEEQGLELRIEALAQGPADAPDQATLYARYTVKNSGAEKKKGSFFLALRYYQVNPPWQFLNTPGGFTPVRSLGLDGAGGAVIVNGDQRILLLSKPDSIGASRSCQGDIVEHLAGGSLPQASGVANGSVAFATEAEVSDSRGFCSGALEYRFELGAGQEISYSLAIPYGPQSKVKPFAWARSEAIMAWRKILKSVDIDLPAAPDLVNTIRSQLAYILVNRDGKALQPGSRCYRRTWIRDGSLTSEALLQLGLEDEVRDFISWFAPFQYADGKVPCCVDKRGADPTPEHDSHGEFIYLVVQYYRYSKNRDLLARLFPQLRSAVSYIDGLRRQRLTDFYKQPEHAHLYGLLPESISHEGYSARPAHSYWDDLFALKGLEDALFAARELGEHEAVAEIGTIYDAFKGDLVASIKASMAKWRIGFIPGAADRGDFDATSTTIALDPVDLSEALPAELASTFEAYWQFFRRRRDGELTWVDYTPYEWRAVGTMVKLGQIDRAHEAIDFFMKDRRPQGWNHWAEVVFKDPLTPRFIGDAPHGWVGSDFLRAVRTLFVYEKHGVLVVGSGLSRNWLENGVRAANLATEYGKLTFSVERVGNELVYRLSGDVQAPIHLLVPDEHRESPSLAGEKRRCVVVSSLPATITVPVH